MLRNRSSSEATNTEQGCSSHKNHSAWHLLLLVSGIIILIAFIFDDTFVEMHFSEDGSLSEGGRHYLFFLRIGLLFMSGVCTVIWGLRKIFECKIKLITQRWAICPSNLAGPAVVLPMNSPGLTRILWSLLSVWTVFIVISLVPDYETYANRITNENGPTETLTVVFYLFAALIALILAFRALRHNSLNRLSHWWFFALAFGCLLVTMEETNWGDLYFHYSAGDFIREINYQHDLSLHNIELPVIGSYWGNKLLHIIALCGGILLPLGIRFSKSVRRMAWAADVAVPPWFSQGCFFIAAVIPPDNVIQLQRANIPSEFREVTIALGVAIWLWSAFVSRNAVDHENDSSHSHLS